jgi:uncharacterized protein (TIGR03067 family)
MKSILLRLRRNVFLVVILALVTACIGCGNGNGGNGDGGGGDESLVGTWSGTEVGGSTAWTFVFTATTMEAQTAGMEVYQGTYTANPDVDPKEITAKITSSSFPEYIGETTYAIYKIEGNLLIFAGNEPGDPSRPTSFTPGGVTRVFELTKQ